MNTAVPDPAVPNAVVYPFWDDLRVWPDSSVRTAVIGAAPDRRFVVEWHNVGMYGSTSARISVEASIAESGQIVFNYADLAGNRERGTRPRSGSRTPPGRSPCSTRSTSRCWPTTGR
ncbi:hypothetical protein [Micromonospora zhanjiangensis]